jgi:hypothetical protein
MAEPRQTRFRPWQRSRVARVRGARELVMSGAVLFALCVGLVPDRSEAPTTGAAFRERIARVAGGPTARAAQAGERRARASFAALVQEVPAGEGAWPAEPVQVSAQERASYAMLLTLIVLSR